MNAATEFEDAVQAMIDDADRRRPHTVVAEVLTYDDNARMVSVRPLQGVYHPSGWRLLPDIHNVPLRATRGAGYVVACPAAAGDVVTLHFADASLERWLTDGSNADPGDPRRHHLSDAIATLGPDPNDGSAFATGGDLVVGREDGAQLRFNASGKTSLGISGAELLQILDDVLAAIPSAVTMTMLGPQTWDATTLATIAAARAKLAQIKV